MLLKNKRVLFFSVRTFNLENEIKLKLEELGAKVDYYDERPNNKKVTKAIIRVYRKIYQKQIDSYYKEILTKIESTKYDYLFVNRAEVIPTFFLEKFIELFPNCKRIFYTWDSFKNHSHSLGVLDFFHEKYSFDNNDCEKYGLKLRPLFFLDSFKGISNSETYENDLLFLGTTHSDRYVLTKRIVSWCKNNDLTAYTFFYVQGFSVFVYKKFFDKTFKKANLKDMNFKGLSSNEMLELYKSSKVILDINHPGQTGLTMRTFEAIGAQKKMITTNKEIKKYNFYNKNNIFVIDREELSLELDFFKSDYEEIDDEIYNKLSLEGWIRSIFDIKEDSTYWIKN